MPPIEPTAIPAFTTGTAPATPEVYIRQYKPSDLDEVIALFAAGMRDYPEHRAMGIEFYIKRSIETDLSDIQSTYITPGGNFWIATVKTDENEHGVEEKKKETIVGMIAIERKPDGDGELRRMSVKEGYRRYGIGRMLVAHLENWARENGYVSVSLSTGWVMKKAQEFYVAFGYKYIKKEVVNEDPHYEAVFYSKQLKAILP